MGWGKGRGLIFILVSSLLHRKNIFCLFQVIHTSVCFFSESSFKTPAISSFIPCFFIYKFLVCWSELLQGKVLHSAICNEANTEHISQGSTKCREECKRYLLDNQLIILCLCLVLISVCVKFYFGIRTPYSFENHFGWMPTLNTKFVSSRVSLDV